MYHETYPQQKPVFQRSCIKEPYQSGYDFAKRSYPYRSTPLEPQLYITVDEDDCGFAATGVEGRLRFCTAKTLSFPESGSSRVVETS